MSKWRTFGAARGATLAVCGLWGVLTVTSGSAVSADPAPANSKPAAGQAEQTPEQAAGGLKNLLRLRKACEADTKRLCPDVKPGGGRLLQCLHEHDADLSPVCRDAVGPHSSKP